MKDKPTQQQVIDAIRIILSDTEHYNTSLNWAVNYCKQALSLTDDDLRVKCLYILGNIEKWRHPQAKEVRDILKAFSKR